MAMPPWRVMGIPRPVRSIPPVYEDFRPSSEWKQEEGSDIVLFYLPAGFLNDQIKITRERSGIITISGERPVEGNKRIRFQEDIRIPENCNLGEISTKFNGQILTVTMPKMIIITQVGPNVDPIPEKLVAQPTPQKGKDDTPPKPTTIGGEKQTDGKSTVEGIIRPDQKAVQTGLDETTFTTTIGGEKQIDGKSTVEVIISPDQKAVQTGLDETTPPKATSTTGTIEKQTEEMSAENVDQMTDKKKEKSEANGKPSESKKTESAVEKSLEKESNEAITMNENAGEKTVEKEKEKSDGSTTTGVDEEKAKDQYLNGTKTKETESVTSDGGVGGGFTLEKYMGMAALVIVALGAYITYTFQSSRKAKN